MAAAFGKAMQRLRVHLQRVPTPVGRKEDVGIRKPEGKVAASSSCPGELSQGLEKI